jgi:hypothetical protein
MILDEAVYMLNKLIMTLCRSHAGTGMHAVMALGSVEVVGGGAATASNFNCYQPPRYRHRHMVPLPGPP